MLTDCCDRGSNWVPGIPFPKYQETHTREAHGNGCMTGDVQNVIKQKLSSLTALLTSLSVYSWHMDNSGEICHCIPSRQLHFFLLQKHPVNNITCISAATNKKNTRQKNTFMCKILSSDLQSLFTIEEFFGVVEYSLTILLGYNVAVGMQRIGIEMECE